MNDPEALRRARAFVAAATRACVLTGAGVSAESGLKTFRDDGGLWEGHRVEDVATPEGFRRDPEGVWRFYNARRRSGAGAAPNAAHRALAAWGGRLPVTVLTQNVDGLHQRAGSRDVVELHGDITRVRCSRCGDLTESHPVEVPYPSKCARCGGLLRPNVVWFGEPLDPRVLRAAEDALVACDLFVVVGTSAVVQPAASFAFLAAARGTPVIEVNLEPTPLSKAAAVSLFGKAGEVLPALLARP